MKKEWIEIEHPGVILKEEFMEPYNITAYRLAQEAGIDKMTLNGILKGIRKITPITGLKLSKFFGLCERFWINLQTDYDTRKAKSQIADELNKIHTIPEAMTA